MQVPTMAEMLANGESPEILFLIHPSAKTLEVDRAVRE